MILLALLYRLIPGALPGTVVSTSFGPAQIQSVRADNAHIAKPLNWKLANNTTATLYLQPEAVKLTHTPGFNEGDEVMTVYGQGYIHKKREKDLVVLLRHWKLAQGYLHPSTSVKIPGLKIGVRWRRRYGAWCACWTSAAMVRTCARQSLALADGNEHQALSAL